MAADPRVIGLLEDMLDSGMTPEEACRDCPELVTEVKNRWREFCRVDEALGAVFPGLRTPSAGGTIANAPIPAGLPEIPGYTVEAILGYGGMGVVYKARQRALDRVVAVKMLLAGPFASPLELGRFRRETAALACLKHPNVMQVYDAGDVAGRPYLTMELVDGGTLARKLAGAPLLARDAAELVATLAGAVDVAHQAGIVHRDLKPVNILLAADGTPKITDFGLARRVEGGAELTQTGVTVGTPNYMAPEQARGQGQGIGPAVDVYALGAILYETLTGRPPFRAVTAAETVRQVIDQEPPPPTRLTAGVPRDLETICLKCLQKDPGKRYAMAGHLAADLGRFLRHEPIEARPTGRVEHFVRWVRRRPAVAGLIAALILLLVVGGVSAGLQYGHLVAARDHREQTDRDVRAVLATARGPLEGGWQAQDLVALTAAQAEGNRALDIARSGAAGPAAREEAEAFRADADDRLGRAKNNRALLQAVLDVSAPRETGPSWGNVAGRTLAPNEPSADEQYASAFRRWGLDLDGTAEAVAADRLRAEPDVVVQEVIAALDGWTMERRRQKRPEAEWRRLFRIADQLDRSDLHRRLRSLLVGELPPRAVWVAGLVGMGSPWPALWERARGNTWRHLLELRQEIDPAVQPALTVVLLARACADVGDTAAAEQVLRQAATAQPGQVVLLDALGKLLERQGRSRLEEAIGYYRAARGQRRQLGVSLSTALCRAGRAKQGEEVLRALIRQQPDNFTCCFYLGRALAEQHKFAEAAAAFRKAIDLEPDSFDAYNNLGNTLYEQQKYAEADAAYRKANALKPDHAGAITNLGAALNQQHRFAEAEAAARKALRLEPDYAVAFNTLGIALNGLDKNAEAEAALLRAIALRPDFAGAYENLARTLNNRQKFAEAEAASRKAIALQRDNAQAYTHLGTSLVGQQRHVQAEAAYRQAIALDAESAETRYLLAWELTFQARFDEAAAALRKADVLLPAKHFGHEKVRQLQQQCQRYLVLDARLPGVLRGTDKPGSAAEQLEFGDLCTRKSLYAAAARFCAGAFAADPKLGGNAAAGARYNAACVAALAGSGRGGDADQLDDQERARWRRQAREWLRQDLSAWSQALADKRAEARDQVLQQLRHWQTDDDLAGLRDPGPLGTLPPDEREECLALWGAVAAVLGRVQAIR